MIALLLNNPQNESLLQESLDSPERAQRLICNCGSGDLHLPQLLFGIVCKYMCSLVTGATCHATNTLHLLIVALFGCLYFCTIVQHELYNCLIYWPKDSASFWWPKCTVAVRLYQSSSYKVRCNASNYVSPAGLVHPVWSSIARVFPEHNNKATEEQGFGNNTIIEVMSSAM